jgi:hypothetical protein
MRKPHSLRAHLTAATPELRTDPDKLAIFIKGGKLVPAGAASISFEYRYTLMLVALDYRSHADAIMVPLMAWLRTQQPEILDNPELRERSVRFEAEYLNNETMDLSIEIDLTEAVVVRPGAEPDATETARRYTVTHPDEPGRVGVPTERSHWQVWFHGDLIAEWDFAPPHI